MCEFNFFLKYNKQIFHCLGYQIVTTVLLENSLIACPCDLTLCVSYDPRKEVHTILKFPAHDTNSLTVSPIAGVQAERAGVDVRDNTASD